MEWLITCVVFFIIQYWIWKSPFFKTANLPNWFSNVLFGAKVLGGIALFVVYTVHYTNREKADIFKFYDDGIRLHELIVEKPSVGYKILIGHLDETTIADEAQFCNWQRYFTKTMINENRLLIRAHALLSFVTFKQYQLHNLLFCFLSFLGIWCITKAIASFLSKRNIILWGVSLFLPSMVLWTDGLLKESLLLFCVGLLLWCLSNPVIDYKRKLAIIFCLLILVYTKTVLAVIVFVAMCGYLLSERLKTNRAMLSVHSSLYLVLIVVALILPRINPLYDYFKVIAKKQRYTYEEAVSAQANSVVELPRITKDPLSVISTIPLGFFYAVAEPLPWQAKGNLLIMSNAAENVLLLMMLFYLLLGARKPFGKRAALFWLFFFIAALYLSFIGLLVPVLGNVVRYKTVVIPLLIGGLLLLQKDNQTKSTTP